jgi:PEP-CTERM motif-containing protein
MSRANLKLLIIVLLFGLLFATPAAADPFFFSTGNPDGKMATVSRPDSPFGFEIESADDFLLAQSTTITSATFFGLLSGGATVADLGEIRVEIYRVFPADSDVGRTNGAPLFSTNKVPTRVNSPSDVEVDDRDTASGNLSYSAADLGSFSALNSVGPGGIHAEPNVFTSGNGPVSGREVEFTVNFTTPFILPPDHYFFVPQVEVTRGGSAFYWLSAPRPIVAPGTPFNPDLQSWTRDVNLDPDWLRVGTDITGQGPFNAAFTLTGTVPEPSTVSTILLGFVGLVFVVRRRL